MASLNIAYLEPFYGGSHKVFVDGLVEQSAHQIQLHTLPHRFWKWRTRGASLAFVKAIPDPSVFDLVVASDLVNLAELQGLWPQKTNTVLYMHENQLTYPLQNHVERDANYVMTDLLSAHSATQIAFNSHSHMNAFFEAVQQFSKRTPDCTPGWIVPALKKKSRVLYPGIYLGNTAVLRQTEGPGDHGSPPVLLWNHRWEYDKVPQDFFHLLQRLQAEDFSFRLILLGDRAAAPPPALVEIKRRFSDQVLFCGYAKTKAEYVSWLQRGDIVISTAIQENFGISCIEAMNQGCFPLFPQRLSYPEIVPPNLHGQCLYTTLDALVDKIKKWQPPSTETQRQLHQWTLQFHWDARIDCYDRFFTAAATYAL